MAIMMDIIFASFMGGIITFITINANIVIRQTWASYNSELMVQRMLVSTAQVVEVELRNMGCGVDIGAQTIDEARDTCVSFKMAKRPEYNSPIVNVKYYSGSTSELTGTENPRDRFLYRQEGAAAPERTGMVTQFSLKYMDEFGEVLLPTPVADLDRIKIIEITIEVQSPFAALLDPEKRYTSALWKQTRLASQNLKR